MANSGDFFYGIDNFSFALSQDIDNFHKRFFMGGERRIMGYSASVGCFVGDQSVYPDAFAVALGQYSFVFHINQLIF